ncbi:hypothetical protein [Sphingopyxis sp.]|uniref:hypothetical protein n=1 Tax=Sphingopyxis sp. TaxID=1908224 RepID=UPI0035B32216
MVWLQENWIIAVVGLVVAVVLLWWLFGRNKAEEIETPIAPSDEPKKPLEAVKPEIIAAEPARFKPKEPAPAPVAAPPPPPPPVPEPVAETPLAPEPEPAPEPTREPQPAPEPAPAPAAKADNLQLLKGVGPKMVALLNGLGVTRFQQIADWTDADVAVIDPQLGAFQGRIARDAIVDQAGYLARGDKAGFEAKYGALGGELQGS